MYALANPVQPCHSARLRLPRATKVTELGILFLETEDISLLSSAYADDLQLVTSMPEQNQYLLDRFDNFFCIGLRQWLPGQTNVDVQGCKNLFPVVIPVLTRTLLSQDNR